MLFDNFSNLYFYDQRINKLKAGDHDCKKLDYTFVTFICENLIFNLFSRNINLFNLSTEFEN